MCTVVGRKPGSALSVFCYVDFLDFIFKPLSMCKCVWQRVGYTHVRALKAKKRATEFPSARVTGGSELPNMGTGNRTWDSSVSAVCILNH